MLAPGEVSSRSATPMKFEPGQRTARTKGTDREFAHLRALVECSSHLIWSVDLDCRLVTFNQAAGENIQKNWGEQAHVEMDPHELLSAEKAALWPPMYARVLESGPYRTEYDLRDGRWLELSFNPITIDGECVGVSVFGEDITERRNAEERIRAS